MEKYKFVNLGKLIRDCIQYKICIKPSSDYYGSPQIQVGNFVFGMNSHSTGISIQVLIIHPKTKEEFTIIHGDYWYNEGHYGFNKFTWNDGAWDKELENSINILQTSLDKEINDEKIYKEEQSRIKEQKQLKEKSKFEQLYMQENK